MPIFEYLCSNCKREFEQLELSHDGSAARCPACGGQGTRLISCPAQVGEPWKVRMNPERLPTWHQNNKKAFVQDAWTRYRQKNPVPGDRGKGIKVYQSDGLKEPK